MNATHCVAVAVKIDTLANLKEIYEVQTKLTPIRPIVYI